MMRSGVGGGLKQVQLATLSAGGNSRAAGWATATHHSTGICCATCVRRVASKHMLLLSAPPAQTEPACTALPHAGITCT